MMNSHRIKITFEKGVTVFQIIGLTVQDTGEYICKATNTLGEGSTRTFIRVKKNEPVPVPAPVPQPTSEAPVQPDIQQPPQQPPQQQPQQQQPAGDAPTAPLTERDMIPLHPPEEEGPRFLAPLRDFTVTDGDRTAFRVFFTGYPYPKVTWYFNSQPIKPSEDFQINIDIHKGESTLVIVEDKLSLHNSQATLILHNSSQDTFLLNLK